MGRMGRGVSGHNGVSGPGHPMWGKVTGWTHAPSHTALFGAGRAEQGVPEGHLPSLSPAGWEAARQCRGVGKGIASHESLSL